MIKNAIEENLHPYGAEFTSYDQLLIKIAERRKMGIVNLRGAAVVFVSEGDKIVRRGVRVMPDGELNFAHAEYF